MTELQPLCDARTNLTALEQLVLEQLRDPGFEIVEGPRCELREGHRETHASLAQKAGEVFWWLVWAADGAPLRFQGEETDRRLYRLEVCPAEHQGDGCLLPDEHAEVHSFEMEPTARREPTRQARRKRAAALREELDDGQRAALEEMESLLAAPGKPLALVTEKEATVITMLLKKAAEADWLVEDMAVQLAERMNRRLGAPA